MNHTLKQMINYTTLKQNHNTHTHTHTHDVRIYFTFISFVKVKAT